ncbi:hypothetical protein [Methanobrevibacter millerae]|nr:hypothetical protein [Methanobrevibacter millerae]
MNLLRFALNTTVKMANVLAKREKRAFDLNERGIMLANSIGMMKL